MKILRAVVVIGSIITLGACTGLHDFKEVEALNEVQPVGNPFTQRLTVEYRDFVNTEIDPMHDHADAIHFARKGLAAARGDMVMPEPITDWNLTAPHMVELSAARARLINAYDLGARELQPDMAAIAQVRFDCWIEQQEENFQPEDIAACKNEFLDSIAQVEAAMPPPPPPAPEPVTAPEPFDVDAAAPMAPENAMYLVFFDFDKSNLGPGAQSVIDAAAEEIMSRSLDIVNVVGHTDTTGPESYNQRLAMRRANAVRDALINRGVDPNMIRAESRGESDLLVQTANGVREPANRRTSITFE